MLLLDRVNERSMPKVADPSLRRAEVVAAASALVATGGPESLSMRKIAEKAGCTIGLINHWFASKDEVIAAVLDNVIETGMQRCRTALESREVTLEQLLWEFLPLDASRSVELRVWLVFWGLSVARPGLRKSYKRRMDSLRRAFHKEFLQRGFAKEDVRQCIDVLITSIDGIVVNALSDPDYWTPRRQRMTLKWLLARIR